MFDQRVLGQRVGHAEAGQRSLYYDIDVKCAWRAEWRGFDLSPIKDGPRPLEGSIRLYNVSHETRYEPGADPTVAYAYQVGYKLPRPDWFDGSAATAAAPPWARTLIDGARLAGRGGVGCLHALVREMTCGFGVLGGVQPAGLYTARNFLYEQGLARMPEVAVPSCPRACPRVPAGPYLGVPWAALCGWPRQLLVLGPVRALTSRNSTGPTPRP